MPDFTDLALWFLSAVIVYVKSLDKLEAIVMHKQEVLSTHALSGRYKSSCAFKLLVL